MLKKLRKFSNIRLLCLTDNDTYSDSINNVVKECKEIVTKKNLTDVSFATNEFDIVLVDYDIDNSNSLVNEIKDLNPSLPIIVLFSDINDENLLHCINANVCEMLTKSVNSLDLRLSMVTALNKSRRVDKISLNEGIYYDSYRERFYNKDGAIAFTNYEFLVLKLLLDNKNLVISYEFIKDEVWKEKKMSIFTMRNIINKIRKKTYYDIIKNNSSSGYQIDTFKL